MAPGGLPMAALSLYILTFNCGLQQIETNAVASQLFNGLATPQLPDLLVLSLQEIAPLPKALIGGSFLVPQFTKFHDAVEQAAKKLGNGTGQDPVYTAVSARNLGMTAIMVFAKNPAAIQNMETGGVGLGLWETGNKGAVGVRFLYNDVNGGGETELTFVAAHLAAMEDEVERRNQDWKDIVRGLVFSSTSQDLKNARSLSSEDLPLLSISPRDASIFKPTSHLFIAGDLNYRTSSIKPSLTDYHDTFPQPHHGNDHSNHWTKLFEHDQLNHERAAGRTMHGLLEPEITFPPTYKYESIEPFLTPDEDLSRWPWARHRWPSWCDRILYLDVPPWLTRSHPAKITTHKYTSLPLFPTSDHRAVALSVSVPLIPIPSPSEEDEESEDPRIKPPFDVNPDWKSARERARMLEVVLGFGLYFITTLEGALVMGATVLGVVGGYYLLKALISF